MKHIFKKTSALALALALFLSSIPSQILAETGEGITDNAVLFYPFNEGSGTFISDGTDPYVDATMVNGTAWSTDVPPLSSTGNSNSLIFDGTNDYVVSGNSPGLPTGDFSYTAWLRPDTSAAGVFIMASDGAGGNEIRIDKNGANKILIWINVGTQITSIGTITPGEWSHVAITRSGSTISIYINGVLDSTATFGTVLNFSTCPLMIGVDVDSACTGGLSDYWDGGIDDVRVYSDALTLSEIEQIAGVMVGTAGFTVTPATDVTMDEGETRTNAYSVVLDDQPTSDVVVTAAALGLTVNSPTLTFNNSNWNVPQDVSITVPEDDGAQDESDVAITFGIDESLSDDLFDAVSDQTGHVDITDNDTPGITVTNIDTLTSECGDTGSVSVVLDTLPTNDVTVNVTSSDTVEGGTVAPSAVTFDGTNLWNVPQTITITGTSADQSLCTSAADGLVDTVEYDINFSVTSVDLDYDAFSLAPVSMTNQDMDPPALLVNSSDIVTSESGDTAEVEICAVGDPGVGTVITIPVSLSDGTEGSLSSSEIIITTDGTSVEDCASVTVTGLDDILLDGDVAYSLVTGDPASLDPSFDALIDTNVADASLTNTDDETAGFTISTDITIPEGETTAIAYTVSLTAEPLSDVVVDISSALTVNTPTLTFTSGNWNMGQNVSLTAPDDLNARSEQDVEVVFTVNDAMSENGFDGLTASAHVDVIDDETAGFDVTSAADIVLFEGNGPVDTYSVVLLSQPISNVVVTISEVSDMVTVNNPALTFTSADWNIPQIVSLTAPEEPGASDSNVTLTFAIDDALSDNDFDALSDQTEIVSVNDNDVSRGGGSGSSSSTPQTEEEKKKITKSITVGTKRNPVTAPKAATVTSGIEETSQTTNTATPVTGTPKTPVLNSAPEKTPATTTPATVGAKPITVIETPAIPRDTKKVFKYVFEDADIITKLGLTQSQYETQCSTKNGANYYRTCKLGTGLKSFIDYRDDVVCEGFISKKADDAGYKMERTAVRSEVVATAVKMKRIDGKSVAMVSASEYTNTFKDLVGQAPWIQSVAETALKYGIVTPKDHFSPSREVTRAEAYALFAKSVCLSYPSVTNKDASWQKNLYEQVKVAELTTRSWEAFKPDRPVLRQEMFAIASTMADWAERTGGCTPKPDACFLSVEK